MSLKPLPVLNLTTPKGLVINLAIPDGMSAKQIEAYLKDVDAGKAKQMPYIDVRNSKGKMIRLFKCEGMELGQIIKLIEKVPVEEKETEEKTGFWVADKTNRDGRFHTLKGCMGRASTPITQAQIDLDKRKMCKRCRDRDA